MKKKITLTCIYPSCHYYFKGKCGRKKPNLPSLLVLTFTAIISGEEQNLDQALPFSPQ